MIFDPRIILCDETFELNLPVACKKDLSLPHLRSTMGSLIASEFLKIYRNADFNNINKNTENIKVAKS